MKLACALLCTLLLPNTELGAAETASLPAEVRADIVHAAKSCEGHIVQEPGFITRRDVLGYGRKAYVLWFGRFACYRDGVRDLDLCGAGGCDYHVFVRVGSKFIQTEVQLAKGEIEFVRRNGRPYLIFYSFNKGVATPNELRWDGRQFR